MVGLLLGFGRARNVDSWRWAVRRGGLVRVVALGEGGEPVEAPADVEVQSACEWPLAPPPPS